MSDRWTMPDWMEPYRNLISNTGGDTVENLMNDEGANVRNNVVRATLCIAVQSQVTLLARMHRDGLLSTSSAVRGMREALEHVRAIIVEAAMTGFNYADGDWAERLYASQAITHAALKSAALSVEGEDEQATRAEDGPTAPISTDTKGTTK